MSSLYTHSFPLLATGANNLDPKETAMTMIQQPNTVISPPPPNKGRTKSGKPNPDAELIALSPKTIMTTNRFRCEVCNKGFKREQNLQLHGRLHDLPWKLKQKSEKELRRKVYICPEPMCVHHDPSRALGDLTGIKKHYYRKHCEKKWKCAKCSRSYALQSDWKAHSRICGTKVCQCDCGAIFSRRDSYISHKTFCDALKQEPARNPTVSFPEMVAPASGSGGRHGFYGGASSALAKQDFYAGALSALGRHGGAASSLPHDQFGNNSNTGLTPPAADYKNRSSYEKFEKLVPQPTNPNPGPTNFLMQFSSNQGLLAHNDQTLRSQRDLISLGNRINNNNNSTNLADRDFYASAHSALCGHGFNGGDRINNNNNSTNLAYRDFYASALSALCGHGFNGGAASVLPHNQFSNNSNTGLTPLAADCNLNRSSLENFEEFVSPPTNPNPGPTNFLKQCSSNQRLFAHNNQTLRSQHDLISLGDRINNNNNSSNPGYFQNNTKNSNRALFSHGAANNGPSALLKGLTPSSLSSVVSNGFGENHNGNLQGLMNALPVTKNKQGWSGTNISGPHFGNNLSMGGSNMSTLDFLGVNGGNVSDGRNPASLDTEMKFSCPNHPFGNP